MNAEITVHEGHKRKARRLRVRRDVVGWTVVIIIAFLFYFAFERLPGWIGNTMLWKRMPPRGQDLTLGVLMGALGIFCLRVSVSDRSKPALRRWTGIVCATGLSAEALVLLIKAGFNI